MIYPYASLQPLCHFPIQLLAETQMGHDIYTVWRTSISSQDGVQVIRFTLPPETTIKLDKIHETMIFKTLDIMQQRTVIPERGKTNEMRPMSSQTAV